MCCSRPRSPRASLMIIVRSIWLSASSAPSMIGIAHRWETLSTMIIPTVPLRPLTRLRAIGLGV